VILLSLWSCLVLPVSLSFEPSILHSLEVNIFGIFIDIAFAVDILLNFRTTLVNDLTKEEVRESYLIARSYVKGGRFWVDLVSAVPLDQLLLNQISGRQSNLLEILKIVRILRFFKVISYLNATENVKLSLKLIKMIFYLVLYLHW
jgi:hypothetical protein